MTSAGAGDGSAGSCAVAVFAPATPERFLPTLRSLAGGPLPLFIGAPDPTILATLDRFRATPLHVPSAVELANSVWMQTRSHVLLVSDAIIAPPDFVDPAVSIADGDIRVGTVSFLCNAAGWLSFPFGQPADQAPPGHDEVSITRRLRSLFPDPTPAPIPYACGRAVLISSSALSAVGALVDPASRRADAAVADFSLRARRRGFIDLLDSGTFYTRPSDLTIDSHDAFISRSLAAEDIEWLRDRHPFLEPLVAEQTESSRSPLALALRCAETKVNGLRVLVDGSCLGPREMGTQVATLAMISALAERDDVAEVSVVLPAEIPQYAAGSLAARKIRGLTPDDLHDPDFERVHVAHRPYQPDERLELETWQRVCERFLVTIHDLISFQIGSYHETPEHWMRYRGSIRDTLERVDGVLVDSADVRDVMGLERMPVDPTRIFVVPIGTDHLTGGEPGEIPSELLSRGFVAGEFLLSLGTNYSHKNRDLALRTFRELRSRGWKLAMVFAGASVPFGSSRALEAMESAESDEDVFFLPDVGSEERNWLLRHASALLYPTSAEGYGLPPFEAARFGTPTVVVGFGPLKELATSLPVVAEDWDADALADAVERLVKDPAVARRQISATLAAGEKHTWIQTADDLVCVYRSLVARPPR
ncbi:MAG: glycosyltransferase [Actinomycetota bacterium]